MIALVSNFTITNLNLFPVEVVPPGGRPAETIAGQAALTFSSYGTYTVKQSGAAGIFLTLNYPSTRLLSTATAAGQLTGDFQISAVLQ
ncbi:hypothetical protein K443DRAFT_683649 [Laccaria amethystina LaAM-08-1]|uniref:Uncharacterized protein n=1 Tax=Laccaria amethystina LaAM-08-1 TaxID=1095629 RepID=A0A0C9X003_9AGAR|nr:hypothetical protein K443DRAFT_683649 [Laccaria amethystina LaAM-08-1]